MHKNLVSHLEHFVAQPLGFQDIGETGQMDPGSSERNLILGGVEGSAVGSGHRHKAMVQL